MAVESSSGAITAKTSFDFEQLKGFSFQVEARDGGIPPRSAVVTVNLFVIDRNDNTPVILFPLPRNGSVPVEIVPRSASTGHLVTKVVAEDADSGSNAWLVSKNPQEERCSTLSAAALLMCARVVA